MEEYRYKILHIPQPVRSDEMEQWRNAVNEELCRLGHIGWEVIDIQGSGIYHLKLKCYASDRIAA